MASPSHTRRSDTDLTTWKGVLSQVPKRCSTLWSVEPATLLLRLNCEYLLTLYKNSKRHPFVRIWWKSRTGFAPNSLRKIQGSCTKTLKLKTMRA